ncbi:uracil-DNA glycosylase family protein [Candidatus Neomarinimicrobiota bacterium]
MDGSCVTPSAFEKLYREAKQCRLCQGHFPDHDPRPIFLAAPDAKVLIVGQAPGRRVHDTGIPWNDLSGDTLREWMGVARARFYDPANFAILPMAYCYPGTEKGKGDRPPPAVCAPTWHPRFLEHIHPELYLLIGRYAHAYYLGGTDSVSSIVRQWETHLEVGYFPLPHPSPRNRKWVSDRPWFSEECIPMLRKCIARHID